MKLLRRSLAYVLAKRSLHGNESRWSPAIFLAISLYYFGRAYWDRHLDAGHVLVAVIFVICAYCSWLQRGMQEVHRELESQLEQERAARQGAVQD